MKEAPSPKLLSLPAKIFLTRPSPCALTFKVEVGGNKIQNFFNSGPHLWKVLPLATHLAAILLSFRCKFLFTFI